MRRAIAWCALFLLIGSAAAWAGPLRGVGSSARAASARAAKHPRPKLQAVVLFGDSSVERATTRLGGGRALLVRQMDRRRGTARWISVYVGRGSRAKTLVAGLYADQHGIPGSLLASGSVARLRAGTWNVVPIKATAVKAGQSYWVAILAKSGRVVLRDRRAGSCFTTTWPSGHLGAVPRSGRAARTAHQCVSAYVMGVRRVSGTSASTSSAAGQGTASNQTTASPTGSIGKPSSGIPTPVTLPPLNVSAPSIAGSAQQGQTLIASVGTWLDSPTSFSYQWQRCSGSSCSNIPGATGSSYAVQSVDAGYTIDVVVMASNAGGSASATSEQTGTATAGSALYSLPGDRSYAWNPGLNSVGGIPNRTTTYRTIAPSGGDDTATIQAALNSCPVNGVVQLTAGVFHISGQGLSIEKSYCTLRGAGPGAGNLPAGQAPASTAADGTYLVKATGTNYPVAIIGPRWEATGSTPVNLTADAVRGTNTATVTSTSGISPGSLVVVDEVTDPNISHWNSQDPANNSGWFEEANRPLGDVMEVASVSGNSLTFTTNFPITYQVAQSAHLFKVRDVVKYSGIEDLYVYGGEGGDGGGGLHLFNCAYCWVKHVEDTWSIGAAIHVDEGFRDEVRDSYFHDSQKGLYNGGANYGIGLNWYTSNSLFENNVSIRFNKVDLMRSAGGGNVFGYNYMDDGADSGGAWFETNLNSSHMTTPHYELFEGNEAANFDQDDRWGNSVYVTVFRNQLLGQLRDFPSSGPQRAAGVTQWHWWQSFVGNVLGSSGETWTKGYEQIDPASGWGGSIWMVCWQNNDNVPDGGKCQSTLLRDGNYDYYTHQVHWHGIGGTGSGNGLTPPANHVLPASMYLTSKPSFFGSMTWPWVDGTSTTNPVLGQLPARARYDAGTPNSVL